MRKGRLRFFLVAVVLVMASNATALGSDTGTTYLEQDPSERFLPSVGIATGGVMRVDMDSITMVAQSPDGSRIAFSSAIGDESLGRFAVYTSNADGTGLDQVTPASLGEFDPAWSPDGTRLVVSQNTSGLLTTADCCRLAVVDLATEVMTPITTTIGAVRPSYSSSGQFIVFDNPDGVWRVPVGGGTPVLIAGNGFDADVSTDDGHVVFIEDVGGQQRLRVVRSNGGAVSTLHTSSAEFENPVWLGNRIYFTEFSGLGYDGRSDVRLMSILEDGTGLQTEMSYPNVVVGATPRLWNDEIFFYRDDGQFRYYNIDGTANLGAPLVGGGGYSSGWSIITAVDIDGDEDDELLFYRASDGRYKYYEMTSVGSLGFLINDGIDYETGWTSITKVDYDGDLDDELFFYRSDGTYQVREIDNQAVLGATLGSGSNLSTGWSSVSGMDLEGDGSDEILFYRAGDGTFKYYDTHPNGSLASLILGGGGYSTGWSSITGVDLDGDGQDEAFFYREDGSFRYYNVAPNGSLGAPIRAGTGYSTDWTTITAVDLGR